MPRALLGSELSGGREGVLGGPWNPWNMSKVFWGSLKICNGEEEVQGRGYRAGEVRYHVLPALPHLYKSFLQILHCAFQVLPIFSHLIQAQCLPSKLKGVG